jgi:hypothetical protein
MKLDMNKPIMNVDEKPYLERGEVLLANKAFAHFLWNGKDADVIKFTDWATKLYSDGFIEIDESDKAKLIEKVDNAELINFIKRSYLDCINSAK